MVSGVVICEYTFDSFRHQRKNKQAKEKKEEKKNLVVSFGFPILCWMLMELTWKSTCKKLIQLHVNHNTDGKIDL